MLMLALSGSQHDGLEIYREQKAIKHLLSPDDAFLRFLEQMDEQAKLERSRNAKVIEHQPSSDHPAPKVTPETDLIEPIHHDGPQP